MVREWGARKARQPERPINRIIMPCVSEAETQRRQSSKLCMLQSPPGGLHIAMHDIGFDSTAPVVLRAMRAARCYAVCALPSVAYNVHTLAAVYRLALMMRRV